MRDTRSPGRRRGTPSGRFVLRIERRLHGALRAAAAAAGLSLNEYCARKLAAPAGTAVADAAAAVERALSLFGEGLIGIVAYGSWARDELADGSDVDLLVILEPGVAITREIYRAWDASPVRWGVRPVEPHFVHFPDAGARISGIWAEAAVDGLVMFERDLEVSRWLAGVRRRIVAGRLVRREAHGQPYWIDAI